MGAYGSKAVTETLSTDECNERIDVGVSSMQGWRLTQEDAHVSAIDFDKNTSLFGVFDGHGGEAVAKFTAKRICDVLKGTEAYKENNLKKSLEDTFLLIDEMITKPNYISEMREMIGEISDESDHDDENEAALLREEANLPLEDLLKHYSNLQQAAAGDCCKKNVNNSVSDETGNEKSLQTSASRSKSSEKENLISCSSTSSSASSSHTLSSSSSLTSSSSSSHLQISSSSSSTFDQNEKNDSEQPSCSINSSSNGECKEISDETKGDSVSSSEAIKSSVINNDSNSLQVDADDMVSSSKADSLVDKAQSESSPTSSTNCKSTTLSSKINISKPEEEDSTNSHVNGEGVSTSSETKSEVNNAIENSKKKSECEEENGPSSSSGNVDNSNDVNENESDDDSEKQISKKGKGKKIVKKSELVAAKKDLPKREAKKPIYEAFLNDMELSDSEEEESEESEANSDDDDDDEEEDGDEEDEEESEDDDDEGEELNDEEEMMPIYTKEEVGKNCGCTAVVALLKGDELYVANAGDSRCVLSRDGIAVDMSIDHKPEDEIEKERIQNAGGRISWGGRVNGGLNLSRAIGDHVYKLNKDLGPKEQMITAFPDVMHVTINKATDDFMVLACDGIWNSMSSQEVIDFVKEKMKDNVKLSKICEEMFFNCLAENTDGDGEGCDNMTCIIVKFKNSLKTEKRQAGSPLVDEDNCKRRKTACD